MVPGKSDLCVQKEETRSSVTSSTKVNSKCINDLDLWLDTTKLLEENTGDTLQEVDIGKDFLEKDPRITDHQNQNTQIQLHQAKKLLHNRLHHQPSEEEAKRTGENTLQTLYIIEG